MLAEADGRRARRAPWLVLVLVFVAFAVAGPVVIGVRRAAKASGGGGTTAGKATVVMAQIAYQPTTLEVGKGTEVTFDNRDIAPHTVTSTSGPKIDSGLLAPGKAFRLVVNEPFDYFCVVHPQMRAKVVLKG